MPSGRASLLRASPAGPGPRTAVAGDMRPPRFRTKDVSTCMGSPTARGPSHARRLSHEMMLPSRQAKGIGTSEMPVSQLNTQPMVSPVNASRQTSRSAAHHSGPERLARPYSAVDFHLLSFASLSWRSRLRVKSPRQPGPSPTSGPGGNPEVSRSIPDIRDLMSGIGGKLTVVATWPEQPVFANTGHSELSINGPLRPRHKPPVKNRDVRRQGFRGV